MFRLFDRLPHRELFFIYDLGGFAYDLSLFVNISILFLSFFAGSGNFDTKTQPLTVYLHTKTTISVELSDFALALFIEKQDAIFDLHRTHSVAAEILYWLIENVDESRAILISQSELGLVLSTTAKDIQEGLRILCERKLISVVSSRPHKVLVYGEIDPALFDKGRAHIDCQLYIGQEPMVHFWRMNPVGAAKVKLREGRTGTYGLYRVTVAVMSNVKSYHHDWL